MVRCKAYVLQVFGSMYPSIPGLMGMLDRYVRQLRHWIVSRVALAMTAEALTIIPGTLTRCAISVD